MCSRERNSETGKTWVDKSHKKAKEDSWQKLCCMMESDPWGKPYKLIMRKLRKRTPIPGIDIPGRVESIIEGLFPGAALH